MSTAGVAMIEISEVAAKKIRSLMAKQGITDGGLRVGVKGGGCSGLSYTFAWEKQARLGDEVNPQRKSSGSQFYICLDPQPFLDGKYTIFGGVVEGMDVVDKIQKGDHIKKASLAAELPK